MFLTYIDMTLLPPTLVMATEAYIRLVAIAEIMTRQKQESKQTLSLTKRHVSFGKRKTKKGWQNKERLTINYTMQKKLV